MENCYETPRPACLSSLTSSGQDQQKQHSSGHLLGPGGRARVPSLPPTPTTGHARPEGGCEQLINLSKSSGHNKQQASGCLSCQQSLFLIFCLGLSGMWNEILCQANRVWITTTNPVITIFLSWDSLMPYNWLCGQLDLMTSLLLPKVLLWVAFLACLCSWWRLLTTIKGPAEFARGGRRKIDQTLMGQAKQTTAWECFSLFVHPSDDEERGERLWHWKNDALQLHPLRLIRRLIQHIVNHVQCFALQHRKSWIL